MTPAERALWARLLRNQLGGLHFRRQQIIDGSIADFYCHTAGLVVELDGPVHAAQSGYDAERDQIIAARGLQVVRFKNDEVARDISRVVQVIAETCRSRMAKNPSPGPSPKKGGEKDTGSGMATV